MFKEEEGGVELSDNNIFVAQLWPHKKDARGTATPTNSVAIIQCHLRNFIT